MYGQVRKVFDRGFGFVTGDNGAEYFFHCKDLRGLPFDETLVGQRVEFATERSARGDVARNITQAGCSSVAPGSTQEAPDVV